MLNQSISLLCLSIFSLTYNEACNKVSEATIVQSGIKENYDKTQQFLIKETKIQSENIIGENTTKIATFIGGTSYSVVVKKTINFSLPIKSFSDTFNIKANETGLDKNIEINFGWNFDRIF